MVIYLIADSPELDSERAERVMANVRATGPVPPEGARLIMAGPPDRGYRVISVWDSNEARERFVAKRLAPAYKDAGLSRQDRADAVHGRDSGSWRSHGGAAAGVTRRGRAPRAAPGCSSAGALTALDLVLRPPTA